MNEKSSSSPVAKPLWSAVVRNTARVLPRPTLLQIGIGRLWFKPSHLFTSNPPQFSQRHRFTAMELAVLVFVLMNLAVIVGVIMLPRAREEARRANCSGNLKSIGVAMLMYSGDYNGEFPYNRIGNSLEPLNTSGYLKDSKVYSCPSSSAITTLCANSDYWYVGGGLRDDHETASSERLAFDMFGNHGGEKNEWMNVLFIDGHVEGNTPGRTMPFWNKNAVISTPLIDE